MAMKRSESRILTTHTGSLPRSPQMQDLLRLRQQRRPLDQHDFQSAARDAVTEVVAHQAKIGLDVINDGEQGRVQYATYVKERLTGFDGEMAVRSRPRIDLAEFPGCRRESYRSINGHNPDTVALVMPHGRCHKTPAPNAAPRGSSVNI